MKISLQELADSLGGEIIRGSADASFSSFGALANARETDICFFGNPKYAADFAKTKAGVVLVPRDADPAAFPLPENAALLGVENPVSAFDVIVQRFAPPKPAFTPGIGAGAYLADSASVDPESVSIGPNAVIEKDVSIASGTRIGAGTFIGEGSTIGKDCQIAANVSIREGSTIGDRVIIHSGVVVGADGFGFEFQEGRHHKIEQLGTVRIDSDVEIGANTSIDRARFGETVIGEGTKIDNQVQIAHNVVIGKHCLVVAQVGIAGSTRIGDYVTLAAMVGVAGHLTIHDRAIVGGGARVISDLPGDETYFGYPAKPMKEDRREAMRVKQLGRLMDRVKALEKQAAEQAKNA